MKYFRIYALLLGVAFLCYSCNNKKSEKDFIANHEIDLLDQTLEINLSQFIDSAMTITLKFPEEEFIGRATQIHFTQEYIFILDKMQRAIYRFENNGKYSGKLCKVGNGNGEYLGISSFFIKGDKICLFDKLSQNLMFYDFSFKFVQKIKCQQWVDNIYPLEKGFLCFTPHYVYNAPNGIWLMNEEGNLDKKLYDHGQKYPVSSIEWSPFYIAKEGIGIHDIATNSFYTFNKEEELEFTMKWDIEQMTISDYEGIESGAKVKGSCWFTIAFVDTPLWTWCIWFNYDMSHSGLYAVYSKEEERSYISSNLKIDLGNIRMLGSPIMTNLPNSLVTINTDENLPDDLKNTLQKNVSVISIYQFKK